MIPVKYNMVCSQGSTFSKSITYKINGEAVDLTDYTAHMQVREKYTSTNFIIDLNTENDGITVDENGVLTLDISASDTASIFAKTYVYDLELINDTNVQRILQGNFIVTPEVTK